MNRMLKLFPELANLDMREMNLIKEYIKGLDEESQETFASIYRNQRRDPQLVLVLSLVGMLMIPGLQRFYVNQIGMGLLYLFTLGLCLIGSIIDVVKYKELTLEYNSNVAKDILLVLKTDGVA